MNSSASAFGKYEKKQKAHKNMGLTSWGSGERGDLSRKLLCYYLAAIFYILLIILYLLYYVIYYIYYIFLYFAKCKRGCGEVFDATG